MTYRLLVYIAPILVTFGCDAPFDMTMVPSDTMRPDSIYPLEVEDVDAVAICTEIEGTSPGRICTIDYENLGGMKVGKFHSADNARLYFENYKRRVKLSGPITEGSNGWNQAWREGNLESGQPVVYWYVDKWFFSINGKNVEGFQTIIDAFPYIDR